MNGSILLTSGEKSGRRVYEGVDTRPLRKSGGSYVSSFSKDVLELLGIVDQDELVDQVDVNQHYQIFVDRGELVVQERIPIQDSSALREKIVEPATIPEPAD
jgi:hypothetical protein